jgi:hypothetical protein
MHPIDVWGWLRPNKLKLWSGVVVVGDNVIQWGEAHLSQLAIDYAWPHPTACHHASPRPHCSPLLITSLHGVVPHSSNAPRIGNFRRASLAVPTAPHPAATPHELT